MTDDSSTRVLAWTHGRPSRPGMSSAEHRVEFQIVYEECLPIVLRYMMARVHDRNIAEDLTADVFEAAMRSWPTFERRSAPRTWVLGIAHHVVSHHWRRTDPQSLPLDAVPSNKLGDGGVTPEDEMQRRDDVDSLHLAISSLSSEDEALLALRYAAGLPFGEIATVLGIREVTLRVRTHRTLRRLRVALAEIGMNER